MKRNRVHSLKYVTTIVYTALATIKHYNIIHLTKSKTYAYLVWQ